MTYMNTLTSMSGADLIVNFGPRTIGELTQISWGIQRQKSPVYTLGSADPRSFSRGKRGIAGSLAFSTFNRDALMEEMKERYKTESYPTQFTAQGNISQTSKFEQALSMTDWNQLTTTGNAVGGAAASQLLPTAGAPAGFGKLSIENLLYVDQLPPMDVTCTWANEYGNAAFMKIFDLEYLNDGSGASVDTTIMERAMTWVARRISPITTWKG